MNDKLIERNLDFHSGMTRRDCVKFVGAATVLGYTADQVVCAQETDSGPDGSVRKPVSALMTGYHEEWHPDVILGKIFDGWKQDSGPGSALQVVSMYVDQPAANDLAHQMSAKHNVPIFDTIEKTVTVGGDRIPVDGVISIGECGNYRTNEKSQDPRSQANNMQRGRFSDQKIDNKFHVQYLFHFV